MPYSGLSSWSAMYPGQLFLCIPQPMLIPTYKWMLEEPIDHIIYSEWVGDHLRSNSRGCRGMKSWYWHNGEERWVLQMYSEECFEKYGGLEMWWGLGAPWEALKAARGEEGMADDDNSSVSDMTEA